jgi:hypothetical protein
MIAIRVRRERALVGRSASPSAQLQRRMERSGHAHHAAIIMHHAARVELGPLPVPFHQLK